EPEHHAATASVGAEGARGDAGRELVEERVPGADVEADAAARVALPDDADVAAAPSEDGAGQRERARADARGADAAAAADAHRFVGEPEVADGEVGIERDRVVPIARAEAAAELRLHAPAPRGVDGGPDPEARVDATAADGERQRD